MLQGAPAAAVDDLERALPGWAETRGSQGRKNLPASDHRCRSHIVEDPGSSAQSEVSPLLMMKAPVQGRAAPQNQKLVICGFLCTIFLQFWHVPDWRSHTGTGDAQAQRWRTGAQRVPSCTASKPVKCRIVSCSVMHRRCKATVTEKDQQQTAVELVCTVIFVARSPCGSTLAAPGKLEAEIAVAAVSSCLRASPSVIAAWLSLRARDVHHSNSLD